MHDSHCWEDVSYHGSPHYECKYCDCSESTNAANKPCPKAAEYKERARIKKEQEEKIEYERLIAREEREKYLKNKYGK